MEIGEIERETKSEKLFYSFFFLFLLDRSTSISGGPGFLWVRFLLLVSFFFSAAIPPLASVLCCLICQFFFFIVSNCFFDNLVLLAILVFFSYG